MVNYWAPAQVKIKGIWLLWAAGKCEYFLLVTPFNLYNIIHKGPDEYTLCLTYNNLRLLGGRLHVLFVVFVSCHHHDNHDTFAESHQITRSLVKPKHHQHAKLTSASRFNFPLRHHMPIKTLKFRGLNRLLGNTTTERFFFLKV